VVDKIPESHILVLITASSVHPDVHPITGPPPMFPGGSGTSTTMMINGIIPGITAETSNGLPLRS
jgi:hypothetical protein